MCWWTGQFRASGEVWLVPFIAMLGGTLPGQRQEGHPGGCAISGWKNNLSLSEQVQRMKTAVSPLTDWLTLLHTLIQSNMWTGTTSEAMEAAIVMTGFLQTCWGWRTLES